METTIVYWGLYGDNGKENGSYYIQWDYIGLSSDTWKPQKFYIESLNGQRIAGQEGSCGHIGIKGVSDPIELQP